MRKATEAKEKSSTRSRSERIRFLNVIYFVDSHRTRSLKFTLRTATISLVLLLLLLSWSFVASGLLFRQYSVNTDLRVHTRKLLSSIFSYQTRYDEVYESAYPGGTLPQTPDAEALALEKGPAQVTESVSNEMIVDTSGDAINALADSTPPAISPKAKVVSQPTKPPKQPQDIPIEIENFLHSIEANTLTIRFALKNLATPAKTSGTVTARAQFLDSSGQSSSIDTRLSGGEDEEGVENSESSSSGQHFNIRYYKNKVFYFDRPESKEGNFSSIEITLNDDNGKTKVFNFPIKKGAAEAPDSRAEQEGEGQEAPYAKATPEP